MLADCVTVIVCTTVVGIALVEGLSTTVVVTVWTEPAAAGATTVTAVVVVVADEGATFVIGVIPDVTVETGKLVMIVVVPVKMPNKGQRTRKRYVTNLNLQPTSLQA